MFCQWMDVFALYIYITRIKPWFKDFEENVSLNPDNTLLSAKSDNQSCVSRPFPARMNECVIHQAIKNVGMTAEKTFHLDCCSKAIAQHFPYDTKVVR